MPKAPLFPRVQTITASTTDDGFTDIYLCSGTITLTLKTSASKRKVEVINTSSGTVTVASSTGSVLGTSSLTGQYNGAQYVWDGSNWYTRSSTAGANALALSGVTAGTATASKAVILGASKEISTITTATITNLTNTSLVRASQTFQLGRGGTAKAGTTAGWTVNAGNNLGTIATVAQSQTNSTLVVAIPNLHVGDTITGFSVYSSINSAGNAVTLDANLRSLTIAAGATATDASIASITQVSVTSATASAATKSSLSTTVAAGVNYYLLLTCSTAASTTLELSQIEVTVTTA